MSNDDQIKRTLDTSATTVTLGIDFPDQSSIDVDVPLDIAFAAFATIHRVGYKNAAQMINFVSTLSRTLVNLKKAHPSLDTSLGLYAVLQGLDDGRAPKDLDEDTREQLTLSFCYSLLRDKAITRPKAAVIATALLKKEPDITPDAWRLKLDRWIERENQRPDVQPKLASIDLPRGRPPSKKQSRKKKKR